MMIVTNNWLASVIGTATPELVFTATTHTAQWVQIYGLLRLTDANDDILNTKLLKFDKMS